MSDTIDPATLPDGLHHHRIEPESFIGIRSGPVPLKRMLNAIPPRLEDQGTIDEAAIGIAATAAAGRRSEARRDAILAVCLAIKRRGGNPVTDWSTRDSDTAYAIADQLIDLENIP